MNTLFTIPTEEQILRLLHRIIHILYFTIPLTLLLMCCSCSTTRTIPQIVEHTARDTLYIGSTQYDSIYRNDSFLMDYRRDRRWDRGRLSIVPSAS